MGQKLPLDIDLQLEAVMSLFSRSETAEDIARRYGISPATLYGLKDAFVQGGKEGLGSRDKRKKTNAASASETRHLEKEIQKRNQIISELTVANNVLKKTVKI